MDKYNMDKLDKVPSRFPTSKFASFALMNVYLNSNNIVWCVAAHSFYKRDGLRLMISKDAVAWLVTKATLYASYSYYKTAIPTASDLAAFKANNDRRGSEFKITVCNDLRVLRRQLKDLRLQNKYKVRELTDRIEMLEASK